MTKLTLAKQALSAFASMLMLLAGAHALAGGAEIIIVNVDGLDEGFNDPTPAAPVGGNTGTTLGEQRLIAFQHAADLWGATLDSAAPIFVTAAFNPLAPNVLGSAGATFVFSDFPGLGFGFHPGVEFSDTWYGSALADKRAGTDLNPGFADINAQFSSNFNWYLGLDNNHGAQVDLVVVLLHELGHGLNFQNFVNESTGTNLAGRTDIYARHTLDNTTGLYWDQMSDAERQASAVNWGNVVWDGANVNAGVPDVLSFGSPEVRITSPASIAGIYEFGGAAFGAPIGGTISGMVVAGLDPADAAGPTTFDGCSPLTNAADVAGNIAIISRGSCGFIVKVKNAQDAGAVAVIIHNTVAGTVNMGGVDPTIVIPSVSVSLANGNAIRGLLPGVMASLDVNQNIRAGADDVGRARIFAPNPVQGGSSGSHYDSIASRNLLMEPAINGDLTHNLKAPDDLSLELLTDIGWFPDADFDGIDNAVDCNPESNLAPTIVIGGNNSGVANGLFNNGCTMSDLIANVAAGAGNHGAFVSGVAHLTNGWVSGGFISGKDKGAIQRAAARANIP